MINIKSLSDEDFEKLPLVVEGESKIVRQIDNDLAVIKFKPTIYSFTSNRAGIVPGSDLLRLKTTSRIVPLLKAAGIKHAYREFSDKFILSDLIHSPPPIEVVVKSFHSGTSKHRYYGMSDYQVRSSHPLYAGRKIEPDGGYPCTLVRFDWRNPLKDKSGKNLADEVMSESLADWFIDVKAATSTALRLQRELSNILAKCDVVVYDLCLFITQDGSTVFGEISQDCGRFRHFDLGSLDKDVWRSGGSSEMVLEKWKLLDSLIQKAWGT